MGLPEALESDVVESLNPVTEIESTPMQEKPQKPLRATVQEPFDGHNLIGYFEQLNQQYFNNEINIPVLWSKKNTKAYHYGITFGVFDHGKQEIRINSRLNQAWVPDFFVKMVLHHEMLHVVVPPVKKEGKVWFHHKEFRLRERQFSEFKDAILWQRANLKALMNKQIKD